MKLDITYKHAADMQRAIAQRNPLTLARIIQSIPVILTIVDRIFGEGKYKKKNAQLIALISTLPVSFDERHIFVDAAEIINR